MNALEDKTLSREALKGFFTFLVSEKERHREDIKAIDEKLQRLQREIKPSEQEVAAMVSKAWDYVSF